MAYLLHRQLTRREEKRDGTKYAKPRRSMNQTPRENRIRDSPYRIKSVMVPIGLLLLLDGTARVWRA